MPSMLMTVIWTFSHASVTTTQASPPKVLAVLPAEQRGQFPELSAIEDSLGDLLAVLLADSKSVEVVERVHLRKVLREKKLALAGITEPARAAEVGGLVAADFIVTSAIEADQTGVVIRCAVIEVQGARIVRTVEKSGDLAELPSLLQDCAGAIAERLDVAVSELRTEDLDRSPRLSLLFMRGLSFYHEGLPERAQVEFMKVIMLDPMHENARFYSARAFQAAKDYEHARLAAEGFLTDFPQSRYRGEVETLLRAAEQPTTDPAGTN